MKFIKKLLIVALFVQISSSADIVSNCTYSYEDSVFKRGYMCKFYVENILDENQIDHIPGEHLNQIGDDAVKFVLTQSAMIVIPNAICRQFKRIQYFECSSKVKSLSQDTFAPCTEMVDLNLNFNVLTNVHRDSFKTLTELKTLSLSYLDMTQVDEQLFKSQVNLERLFLCYNRIISLAAGTFSTLTNLKILHIGGNRLTSLEPTLFSSLVNLGELHLTSSSFNYLSDEIFKSQTNLKQLYLERCQFSDFHPDVFKNLYNVSSLYLNYNKLSVLNPEWFRTTKSLVGLSLDNNQISKINSDIFGGLPTLQYINLGFNQIEEIPEDTFKSSGWVRTFMVESNKLKTLNMNIFSKNITYLGFVNMNDNQIESIDKKVFDYKLEGIRALNNTCMSAEFWTIPNKTEVMSHFESCFNKFDGENTETTTKLPEPITKVPEPTTANPNPKPSKDCRFYVDPIYGYTCELTNITFNNSSEEFVMSGAHLAGKSDSDVLGVVYKTSFLLKVPQATFDQFINLEFLNIRKTRLEIVDKSTLGCSSSLKWLDSSDNQIRLLSSDAFAQCENLETLLLDNNYIIRIEPCNNFITKLKNLKHLAMKMNMCIAEDMNESDFKYQSENLSKGKLNHCFSMWFM